MERSPHPGMSASSILCLGCTGGDGIGCSGIGAGTCCWTGKTCGASCGGIGGGIKTGGGAGAGGATTGAGAGGDDMGAGGKTKTGGV